MNQMKVIRRKNALSRFTMMTKEQFAVNIVKQIKGGTFEQYVARKEQELKSLKGQ